jgi:hypothetical protein
MDLFTKIQNDLNKRMELIEAGKYDRDELKDVLAVIDRQISNVNWMISAYGVASKNMRAGKAMSKKNVLDSFSAVALPTNGLISCRVKVDPISKEECLDYSGSHTECQDCEVFGHSRKVVLGEV